MSETLLRQWELLRAIPREPKSVTVTALMARLHQAGYSVVKRTVQRDLTQLSAIFPLTSATRHSAFAWSWSANSPVFDLPTMDGPTALSVRMIEQFMPALLPPHLGDQLAPQFARARAILSSNPSALARWADRVRVVPAGMQLNAPRADSSTVREVYDALLAGRRFTASYKSRESGTDEAKRYEVSPLGLVARGQVIYLVCTLWNYQDLRQLAVHRLDDVVALTGAVVPPEGFDLDSYIRSGEFQYPLGPPIRLAVRFSRAAAAHLAETPLSEDQHFEDIDRNRVLVTATVADSRQLEWWLMGLMPDVEVLEPPTLRQRLVARVTEALKLYESQPPTV